MREQKGVITRRQVRVNTKRFVLDSKIKRKTEGIPVWENRGE